ncbi:MAG: hypothetical protein FJ191_14265 [Gammaproteobacteria bacterium]|nr:hypothetical protein [Gammaproteobacteria bacterium]
MLAIAAVTPPAAGAQSVGVEMHAPPPAAVSLPIVNAGFEAPAIAVGSFSTTAPPNGWVAVGNIDFSLRTVGVLHPATTQLYPAGAPEGNNVGVVFLLDDFAVQGLFTNQPAGLAQTLGSTLATSTRYELSVEIGNIANDPDPPNNLFQFNGFPGYRIELLAGGVLLAARENAVLPAEGTFLTDTLAFESGASHPLAGQALGLRLLNLNAAPGIEVNFDDVRLEATPSAWTDLGSAKPGSAGVPQLVGTGPLTAGSANALALNAAAPGAPATLVAGLGTLGAPFKGGTLVPSPLILIPFIASGAGAVTLPFAWPAGVPAGTQLFMQFWISDAGASFGLSASNAVAGTAG